MTALGINHVAISVPDVDAAVSWYCAVFGMTQLQPTVTHDRRQHPDAAIFKIYPGCLQKVRVAFLSAAGNGVGLELFQFEEPKMAAGSEASFDRDYMRGGFFHMAVTTGDIASMIDKVVSAGGRLIGEKIPIYEYEACYVADPWGNVVELITASFERVMSNR